MEYIKTFESYIKTFTAVIEILKPYAWMNLDKYIQAVPYHLTKERLIFIHLGHGERRNISTKNIKILAVFDDDMYDKEFIKKYIKDRQDEKKLNESLSTVLENPFVEGVPTIEKVKEIQKWFSNNNDLYENKYVKFYHGTDKNINVLEEGLLPTSAIKRRRSHQSTSGYVYLANTPERAREFGERANPYGCNVYEVIVLVRDLKPDLDQLNNMRSIDGYDFIKDTVAYSMIYGGGVRIKGKIEPWQIKLYTK